MRSSGRRTADLADGRVWTLPRSKTFYSPATGSAIKACFPMRLLPARARPHDSRLAKKDRCCKLSWYESDRNFQRVPAVADGDRLSDARQPCGCRGRGPGNVLTMAAIE